MRRTESRVALLVQACSLVTQMRLKISIYLPATHYQLLHTEPGLYFKFKWSAAYKQKKLHHKNASSIIVTYIELSVA